MILKIVVVTDFATNCYAIGCSRTREGAIIDPGGNPHAILATVKEADIHVRYVINTHGHVDHIGANGAVMRATGASLVAHKAEAPMLTDPARNLGFLFGHPEAGPAADLLVEEGATIAIGDIQLQVLHTPGHTPGSISLYAATEGIVFSGDTLFKEGIGRTDLPGGNHKSLIQSIRRKLLSLPNETVVYPGHGPTTTLAHEQRFNPWLQQETP